MKGAERDRDGERVVLTGDGRCEVGNHFGMDTYGSHICYLCGHIY